MGIPGSANLLLAAAEAESYQLEQSLRFNDGDSAYLLLNGGVTPTNGKIATHSVWVKRSLVESSDPTVFGSAPASTLWNDIKFDGNDRLIYRQYHSSGGAALWTLTTAARYRDPSAWLHIVVAIDTTQSTSSDRVKMYVNGAQITAWDQESYPGQNQEPLGQQGSYGAGIGRLATQFSNYFDGYMAEYHHVDGVAHDPTDFGEYDDNGVWRPIEVTGITYGNRGWYLTFDPTATNGIGHDHSGSGNHFTANNFTTSGGGTDVMSDTPTTNYATINTLGNISGLSGTISTIEEGNLKQNSNGNTTLPTTIAIPAGVGKWYWEAEPNVVQASSNFVWGVQRADINPANYMTWSSVRARGVFINTDNQNQIWTYGSTSTSTAWTVAAGDILGFALDASNGNLAFYKNGALQDTLSGAVNTSYPHYPAASGYQGADTFTWNFGQRELAYPPGTYSAGDYFNTVTYAGDGSTQSITGVGFQPDLVWIKARNQSENHYVADSIRGAYAFLGSNTTGSQNSTTNYDPMSSFDSDGFTVRNITTSGSTDNQTNDSGVNYVAWCWKAGGTASSNTDGSQTASVSANDAAGFSIMTWNYSGSSSYTVGHGLSTAPKVLFVKKTDGSTNWFVRHGAIHTGNGALFLNSYTAGDSGSTVFNGTAPTDSVISLNGALTDVRGAHVCYAFAEKAGVSKFGSYTGNGSVDGPEVNDLGFAPALLVIKRDGTSEWAVYDSARGNDNQLRWDQIDTDNTNSAVNVRLTSNGFKIATSDAAQNASGGTYIYMAWARDFTVDGDYKALNTSNLPAPDIKDGSKHFNTLLYTGDGTAPRSLTGVGFQPDWVWVKARDQAWWHVLGDSVRGSNGTNGLNLNTNDTAFEGDENSGHVESWDSDGFTVEQADSGANPLVNVNNNNSPYVAWNWKAGGTASSNTAGSITSTVSANPSAGFSILTWTGTGAVGTLGHGLGVAPGMIIVKSRSIADDWYVFHSSLGATKRVQLNNDAVVTTGTSVWNSTSPTSTVFSIGNGNPNSSNVTYVAYCFAEVEGYSKISEFTGNGSTDGAFVYCGFKPSWILLRRYEASRNWYLYDAARDTFNVVGINLFPDLANAEGTADALDILSNGFKMRTTNTSTNGSGDKIMFIAFASNPFGGSGVSPATAR